MPPDARRSMVAIYRLHPTRRIATEGDRHGLTLYLRITPSLDSVFAWPLTLTSQRLAHTYNNSPKALAKSSLPSYLKQTRKPRQEFVRNVKELLHCVLS